MTRSAGETRSLGAALAQVLRRGDVVVLSGDLGAGKTVLVQGVAAGLGVPGPVVSPSFARVHEYEARIPIAHVDVYRLDRMQELHDLGFEELIDGDRVTLVEWGEAVAAALPMDRLVIRLDPGAGDDERIVTITPNGGSWRERSKELAAVMAALEVQSATAPDCARGSEARDSCDGGG